MSLRWKWVAVYLLTLLIVLLALLVVGLSLFTDDGLALRYTAWPVA